MRNSLICALASLAMAGCSPSSDPVSQSDADNSAADATRAKADEAKFAGELNLSADLKDSSSAKFRQEYASRLSSGNLMLCGEVNSKNAFGAYTGYKRFIASPDPDAPNMIEGETASDRDDDPVFRKAWQFACSAQVQRF